MMLMLECLILILKKNVHLWANEWCICIATLVSSDGPTHLFISDKPFNTENYLVFDGTINTPRQKIGFSDANLTDFYVVESQSTKTRIRIWTDHATEPEVVMVAIG